MNDDTKIEQIPCQGENLKGRTAISVGVQENLIFITSDLSSLFRNLRIRRLSGE